VLGQPPGQFPGGMPVAAASPGAQDLPGPGLVTARECARLHGGTGFTWEHPADLYRKRAKADSIAFGTPDAYRAALVSLASLPRRDPGLVRHGAQPAVIKKRLNHTDAAPSTPITRPSSHAGSGARSRATGTLSRKAGSRKRGLEPR
jgi:hypothetical protein